MIPAGAEADFVFDRTIENCRMLLLAQEERLLELAKRAEAVERSGIQMRLVAIRRLIHRVDEAAEMVD